MKKELVIASANVHKIREFREMLKGYNVDLLSLLQFPECKLPEETGSSFRENGLIKARYVSQYLKKLAIADDSGLIVPMLKGAPGIHSKRYAGENASDQENSLKLLKEMSHLTGLSRSAYFECCLVLCNGEGLEKSFTGTCEGMILTEQRGRNGFGYDSLFIKHDYEKTFAELDETVKNRISHRAKAFEKLSLALEGLGISKVTRSSTHA